MYVGFIAQTKIKDGTIIGAKDLEQFREILARLGIESGIDDLEYDKDHKLVYFTFDEEKVFQRITRNAGPHEKYAFNTLTMAEYKSRRAAGETAAQIADYVGLSRATFYRRVKAAEKRVCDDDMNYITV